MAIIARIVYCSVVTRAATLELINLSRLLLLLHIVIYLVDRSQIARIVDPAVISNLQMRREITRFLAIA